MRTRVFILFICIGLIVNVNTLLAQDDDGRDGSKFGPPAAENTFRPFTTPAAGNDIYEVLVSTGANPGLFTARTAPNHPITIQTGSNQNVLFGGAGGNPSTSYNTVRSYSSQTDYVPLGGRDSAFNVLAPQDLNLDTSQIVDIEPVGDVGYRVVWDLPGAPLTPDNLLIVQEISVLGETFEDSRIKVSVSVTNEGMMPVDIGIRFLWDFQIGTDDGPTFTTVNPAVGPFINETQFLPEFDFFRIEDNDTPGVSPLFSVSGTIAGPTAFFPTVPDLVQFTAWGPAFGQAFTYPINPARAIAVPTMTGGDDSAVTYFFGPNPNNAITIGSGDTFTATQFIFAIPPNTNTPPVAEDDEATTASGETININVLENDFDLDGDDIFVQIVQPTTQGGTVVILPNFQIQYTPPPGFTGEDTFFYTVADTNGNTDIAQVTVNVEAGNLPPVLQNDNVSTTQNTPVNINVLANDSDPENDPLTVVDVTNGVNGTLTINADNTITYTPTPGFTGLTGFTYTVSDGNGNTASATVNITVNQIVIPNAPPVATPDTANTDANMPVVISILANDFDPEGGALILTNVAQPANGTVVVNADNTVTYTPNPGLSGTDSFTYTITDPEGLTATTTVTINIAVRVCVPGDPDYNPEVDLSGALSPESDYRTGTVTNTSATCAYDIGLASYQMVDETIDNQVLFASVTGVIAPNGTLTLTVDAPTCARQIDLFYGEVLQSLMGQRYGERLLDALQLDRPNWCVP